MFAILLLIPILITCIILRKIGLGKVEYRRYFSEEGVFEGEGVILIEEIANPFFFPLIMVDVNVCLNNDLRLSDYAGPGIAMQEFTSRFYLPPFTQIKRRVKITCTRRGYFRLESVTINGRPHPATAEIHVYPRALPYNESSPMESEMQSTALTTKRLFQDPFSFSGIRDYRYGDTFRSINYKATAKTGAIKVNDRDFFSSRNIMVYIDFAQVYPHPLTTEEYNALMEEALSYSADMVWTGIQQGFSVGFAANCRSIKMHAGQKTKLLVGASENYVRFPMGRGHSHYKEVLKEMAAIRLLDGCSFMWLLKQDIEDLWNVDIFIMTTNMDQPFDELREIYHNRGNHLTVLELRV